MSRRCRCHDPAVFWHTDCRLRPAWAVNPTAAEDHDIADYEQRTRWAMEMAKVRGPQRLGAGVGPGMPGTAPQGVSGDRGAVLGPSGAGA